MGRKTCVFEERWNCILLFSSLLYDFFEEKKSKVEERLKEIDTLNITPLEALNILCDLKKMN